LCRFEPVSGRDCHPPGRDLVRAEFVESPVTEDSDRSCQQPAQFLERYWGRLVMGEVLLDEFGKRERLRDPVLLSQLLERSLKGGARIALVSEAATLHPARIASTGPVAIRPQGCAVTIFRPQLEDLTLLQHRRSSSVARSYFEEQRRPDAIDRQIEESQQTAQAVDHLSQESSRRAVGRSPGAASRSRTGLLG